MSSNSVATEIEKQTGLKRSTKTKKYAQETGRGNIAYAMRFAGYRYSGDFHVVKDYGNTFEVITDSPEGESKLNDILQVLNNLGLEIVAQGRTHISFKIPLDENKWYGADGSYRKGKWKLYKRWNKDGEYALYNDDDENFVHNITAYTPSQAKYSADYFIEQFEKGEIMNSKNQTVVRQGPNLKTLNETPAEHIMKNLDAYKGYTRYDMEQLVLNPSGYTLYNGDNRNAVYKKDGAEDITLLFRNGELKDAKITSSRKPIKSGQQSLFSNNVFDGKVKLFLADNYNPYHNSGDKYVDENGNLYFYIQSYIPNVKRDKENPGVMIGSIDNNLIYFDENDMSGLPKEVYVDPSFDKELAIKKTVNYSISSVYDYLSTSLPIMKELKIPDEGCILKQDYKEFADVGNIFNYFKTVAKKRGSGSVYAKIKVSYSDKPLTAQIDSSSLRPAVLLNDKQILVLDKNVDFVAFYFKKNSLKSVTASRKPIKSSQAKLHSSNMEDVKERLEQSVAQSSVETLYDGEDCFITVTQKNYETGNESEWSFVVDFGTNKVQMLEPTEDEEGFTSDNEIYRIIKNFLNGGTSREKRMNRPDYNSGEPIKVTGKGNKIGNSRQSSMPRYNDEGKVWSDSCGEYVWEKVKYKDGDTYHWDDINCLYWNDNGDESDYLMITTEEGLPKNCTPIKNSRKSIKSEIIGNETSDKFIIVGEDDNYTDINGHFRRFYWNEDKKRFLISLSDATEYDTKDEAAYELQNHIPNRYNDQFRFFSIERKTSLKPQIYESRKPIKSSLSDVNKALGFTDNDIEEDGKIHITTDFGEFVVDYVNDDYIVTYDGRERIFTEYKDTVEEVVDLFNQLCNEEIKLFNENINSSKPIKSDYSDEEYWYPETKKVYRLYKYNSNGDYYTWDYDTLEEAQRMKPRGNRYTSYNIKEVEVPVQSSRKSIKSSKSVCVGFNTENGTLLWKRDDLYTLDGSSIRQTKQKDIADRWIEKYNLNTTDTERLDKYTQEGVGQIPWGLPLVEDKDQTNYNKKLASILPPHNVNSSYGNNPLPTERDYRDFVDKLNNYCKNMKFSYGPMYEFEYEPEEGMSNDGWGHEYPNFRIYDTQGNLDMFSDDSIVKYIRNELKKKGWYPEAVHSSSDFTIAVE